MPVPTSIAEPWRFRAVAGVHLGAYLGGVVGGVAAVVSVARQRRALTLSPVAVRRAS